VLMDVQMPVLDGYDATQRIREGLGLVDLPIIALTAGALSSERAHAEAVGMNDFLAKPLDPATLVRTIRRHVTIHGDHCPPIDATAPAPLATRCDWPQIVGIDVDDAYARLHGDMDLFRFMLRRLCQGADRLRREGACADLKGLAAHLHDLKGSAGTVGAKPLAVVASEAEIACRAGLGARAQALVSEIAVMLADLESEASAALTDPPTVESGAVQALQADELSELLRLLREFDLTAVDRFKALSAQLRGGLEPSEFLTLEDHVDKLQFANAVEVIEKSKIFQLSGAFH